MKTKTNVKKNVNVITFTFALALTLVLSSCAPTLTVFRNPEIGGDVTPASGEKQKANRPVEIQAHPTSGYRFVNWSRYDGDVQIADTNSANTTIVLRKPAAIIANFERTFSLMTNVNPASGGTAAPANTTGVVMETPLTISASPAQGYRFVNWQLASGRTQIADANSATTTITMNAHSENAVVVANFERMWTVTLVANIAEGGTIENAIIPDIVPGHFANINANINDGYRFAGWTIAQGSAQITEASHAATTVIPESDVTIIANFERLLNLTITANSEDWGSVRAAQHEGIIAGSPVSIAASPISNYEFVNWTVTSGVARFANMVEAATDVMLSDDAVVVANFRRLLTLGAAPNIRASGTITTAQHQNISAGAPIEIRAVAASGYQFMNWSAVSGEAEFANMYADTTTVTLQTDAVINANFRRVFTLAVNASSADGGYVTPTALSNIPADSSVEITATIINNDYRFVNWTVRSGRARFADANSMNTTVSISANAVIVANFQQVRGMFTDSRDGQSYNWVRIGNRSWMASNLNFAEHTRGLSTCYNDRQHNCNTHGRLYSLEAARAVCPAGWRLPNDADWTDLVRAVGGVRNRSLESDVLVEVWNHAGTRLKSRQGWQSNANGTDDFGFNALPGGWRSGHGFGNMGSTACWWSNTGEAYWCVNARDTDADKFIGIVGGRSVRCVRN